MDAEICVKFAVLTVVSKMQVLWDVKFCWLVNNCWSFCRRNYPSWSAYTLKV